MNARVDSARVALVAELLGEFDGLMERTERLATAMEVAASQTSETVTSLVTATQVHRDQLSETVERLRLEFAILMKTSTDQAAASVVAHQSQVIERAATSAIRQTITRETVKRSREDWMRACVVGAGVGSVAATLVSSAVWGVVSYTLNH